MKVTLISTGRTDEAWVREGMDVYIKRLGHYTTFSYLETDDVKSKTRKPDSAALLKAEAERQLRLIGDHDVLVLFDEHGKEFSSVGFAEFFAKHRLASTRQLTFLIGGAHGFAPELLTRANSKVALSKMTFPHKFVRVIALEQIYRAHTLLKGEPYHHI